MRVPADRAGELKGAGGDLDVAAHFTVQLGLKDSGVEGAAYPTAAVCDQAETPGVQVAFNHRL